MPDQNEGKSMAFFFIDGDNTGFDVTPEGVRFITEIATKAGIEAYNKARVRDAQDKKNKRLHNTKLLLRIYRELKAHSNSSIYDIQQCPEDVYDVLTQIAEEGGFSKLEIGSIKTSVARTRIIIEHIDRMLDLYGERCTFSKKPEDGRRYRVIMDLYINEPGKTAQEIADKESIELRSVYRDVDTACEKLSAYFFGVDWI